MTQILSGLYSKRKLMVPKGTQVRPSLAALKKALFDICQFDIEGASFLDLFAGSGSVGLEALSRRAASVTFVESDPHAISAIRHNIASLNVSPQCTLLTADVFITLKRLAAKHLCFDIIFADPPYGHSLALDVLSFLDTHPLLSPHGSLFLEETTRSPLPSSLTTLTLKSHRRISSSHLWHFVQF